ncbi:MAG: hypothetical protein JW795_02990, partial [Chitinivibrionales bacterium]|nr:hypothetical protein [Chitinivibrionales bacterium]
KLINSLNLFKLFDVSGIWIYSTGAPYSKIYSQYQIQDPETNQTKTYLNFGPKNGNRLKDYHRLDVNLMYSFALNNYKGGVGIALFNVYNNRNPWKVEYFEDFNQFSGETIVGTSSDVGMPPNIIPGRRTISEKVTNYMGIVPSVFIRFNF